MLPPESEGRGDIPDAQLLLLASDLRVRAEEVLAKAETMADADAQKMMHAVAVSYNNFRSE